MYESRKERKWGRGMRYGFACRGLVDVEIVEPFTVLSGSIAQKITAVRTCKDILAGFTADSGKRTMKSPYSREGRRKKLLRVVVK